LSVHILSVDILLVDILLVDILSVDIQLVDILLVNVQSVDNSVGQHFGFRQIVARPRNAATHLPATRSRARQRHVGSDHAYGLDAFGRGLRVHVRIRFSDDLGTRFFYFGGNAFFVVHIMFTQRVQSQLTQQHFNASLKSLRPGGIRTRIFCFTVGCDAHCATPPPGQELDFIWDN
jgi:hypothetical protein